MSTEYCISTNALGLTPLMRTKTTPGADERRENRKPDTGADPVGGCLAAAVENLQHREGGGGNSFGRQPRQPDENPSRQATCRDGGRGEACRSPLPVGECEDYAAGGRRAESGGPRDTGWGA